MLGFAEPIDKCKQLEGCWYENLFNHNAKVTFAVSQCSQMHLVRCWFRNRLDFILIVAAAHIVEKILSKHD